MLYFYVHYGIEHACFSQLVRLWIWTKPEALNTLRTQALCIMYVYIYSMCSSVQGNREALDIKPDNQDLFCIRYSQPNILYIRNGQKTIYRRSGQLYPVYHTVNTVPMPDNLTAYPAGYPALIFHSFSQYNMGRCTLCTVTYIFNNSYTVHRSANYICLH